jgi:hypothetical protein
MFCSELIDSAIISPDINSPDSPLTPHPKLQSANCARIPRPRNLFLPLSRYDLAGRALLRKHSSPIAELSVPDAV